MPQSPGTISCSRAATSQLRRQSRIDRIAVDIRSVGVEHAILSSDLGQAGNALPADGLAAFIHALRTKGFTDQELDRMAKQNPAALLGLE